MSSSTSNSNHWRFLALVALGLVASNLVVQLVPWGGVSGSKRNQQSAANELAENADFLIVGDSKAGRFSVGCLLPWFSGLRGLVFSADSVTPVFHFDNLLELRRAVPDFNPAVVFVFLGANNFNKNGLHVERDYAFFSEIALDEAWELSARQGDYLSFATAALSRLLPLYGKRIMITHLQIGDRDTECSSTSPASFEGAKGLPFEPVKRNAVLDRNYLDIYRRSVYASYESSPLVARATEKLIELIMSYGALPVLVLPPVTPEMRALEQQLIGDAFDETLAGIASKHQTRILDLRDRHGYEFEDVNHLSPKGARDLAINYFLPIIAERRAADPAADDRGELTSQSAIGLKTWTRR